MKTNAITRRYESLPTVFENFLRPWADWTPFSDLDISQSTLPAVNVVENEKTYELSLAVPGMDRKDFNIVLDGNIMTISSEKEETKEDKVDEKYSRKEYNFSSFSRSFTLPSVVSKEKIDARYENGILKIKLPKNEEAVKASLIKSIEVK